MIKCTTVALLATVGTAAAQACPSWDVRGGVPLVEVAPPMAYAPVFYERDWRFERERERERERHWRREHEWERYRFARAHPFGEQEWYRR